jgi:hypothetical protein
MESSILNALGGFISQVGFPVFVAVWLLRREDRILATLIRIAGPEKCDLSK